MKRPEAPPKDMEHIVDIDQHTTVDAVQAKRFKGAFANQNFVGKLRDEAAVDFLIAEFGVEKRPPKK